MIYVRFENGSAVQALTSEEVYDPSVREQNREAIRNGTLRNANDWTSFAEVIDIAAQLTSATGELYIPVDAGPHTSHRYDVVRAPKVGDEVSYSFNGDTYPCGTITKIGGSNHRIVYTSDGKKFMRRKLSGSWINNGTWALVHGHITERNPHF